VGHHENTRAIHFGREILQLGRTVLHRKHSLGVVDVRAGLELEAWDRGRIYVDQTPRWMVGQRPHFVQYCRPPTRKSGDFKKACAIGSSSMRAQSTGGTTSAQRSRTWGEVADPRNPLGRRQGVNERIMLRGLLWRVDMMVILENNLDAWV